MKIRRTALRAGLAGTVALGAIVASQFTAGADPAPSATDVVGVGSDIIQNSINFLADGVDGYPGYNTAGNVNRLANYDATADANGRNAFLDPALGQVGNADLLDPTVTLQAGTSPVTRPNGGSVGLLALTFDGDTTNHFQFGSSSVVANNWGSPQLIDFARTPNLPTSANQTAAKQNLGTELHSVRFAVDKQYVAAATTTNAPTYLSTLQLAAIYKGYWTDWRQVPGSPHYDASWYFSEKSAGHQDPLESGVTTLGSVTFPQTGATPPSGFDGSAEPIYAEYPQDGAGVLKIFATALVAANGKQIPLAGGASFGASAFTSTSTLASTGLATGSSTLHSVQQNDPTTITGLAAATKINAIVPFPEGRYKRIQSGYFNTPQTGTNQYYNPNSVTNGGLATPAKTSVTGLQLLTPGAAHPSGYVGGSPETDTFAATIPYYVVYRASDEDAAPWQPGSTLNWVQTLFYNPGGPAPFLDSAPGQALIEHLGLTASYSYQGNNLVDNSLS
jgi:hypothetical protein